MSNLTVLWQCSHTEGKKNFNVHNFILREGFVIEQELVIFLPPNIQICMKCTRSSLSLCLQYWLEAKRCTLEVKSQFYHYLLIFILPLFTILTVNTQLFDSTQQNIWMWPAKLPYNRLSTSPKRQPFLLVVGKELSDWSTTLLKETVYGLFCDNAGGEGGEK